MGTSYFQRRIRTPIASVQLSMVCARSLLFGFLCAWSFMASAQGIDNDDRDVIQTAMLSFFKHEDWHSADWKPKRQVIIRSQFQSKERPSFNQALDSLRSSLAGQVKSVREYVGKRNSDATEMVRLRKLLSEALSQREGADSVAGETRNGNYAAPELVPLKNMQWDKRIVISDERTGRFRFLDKRASSLEDWTVQASVARPTYSSDGRFAILELEIPWSIHSSDVVLLYERTATGWVRRAYLAKFYV